MWRCGSLLLNIMICVRMFECICTHIRKYNRIISVYRHDLDDSCCSFTLSFVICDVHRASSSKFGDVLICFRRPINLREFQKIECHLLLPSVPSVLHMWRSWVLAATHRTYCTVRNLCVQVLWMRTKGEPEHKRRRKSVASSSKYDLGDFDWWRGIRELECARQWMMS